MKSWLITLQCLALPLAAAAFAARLAAQQPAPAQAHVAAPAASAASAADAQGFLYGKITTRGGQSYQGRLRWDTEEAFWGDFFNSQKRDRPYERDIPRKERQRRKAIEIFGIDIGLSHEVDSDRQFVARFGDIDRIERERGDNATVVMKTGSRHRVSGGSNDLEAKISVWDAAGGEVQLDWDAIRTIQFLPAPAGLRVAEHRLQGTAHTEVGELRGFVQWDQQECLSGDKLDGETREGKISLDMGSIRAIEPRRNRSRVLLRDGREMMLEGTNDVDGDNRGLYVDDARYGRVLVPWSALRRLDLGPPGGSGPGYGAYRHGAPLRGRVFASGGKSYTGRIVYDADESETWEMLNGSRGEIEYSIPLALVATVTPVGDEASKVLLKSGEELTLEDAVDVDRENAGLLVYGEGAEDQPRYVPWSEVRRVELQER